MFLFPLGKFLGVELLHKMEILHIAFERNCQAVVLSGWAMFHSHQQCVRASVSPHLPPYLAWSVFLFIAFLVGLRGVSSWF